MSLTTQTVTLSSDRHYGRKIPPHALGPALTALPVIVRQSVSMAFRGRSGVRGPRPGWLKAATDLRFLDHQGDDDTRLVFEVPTLGQAASELYQQQEFWPTRPDPGLTAIDVLGEVVSDVAARNEDSDRFDKGLLHSLARFRSVLGGDLRSIRLDPSRAGLHAAVIDREVIATARRFQESTPLPQRVRVVGTLDMVRASTQSFALRLDDGQEVRGVLVTGNVVGAASHLNRRVLVLGKAVYRASGRLLRIDADEITEGGSGSSLWSRMPRPRRRKLDLTPYRKAQGPRSGMSAIMGRWPGDETDEEIREALERLFMTIGPGDLITLDTNVLVHWVRQDRTGQHLCRSYHLEARGERPLFSTITEGEILGLAKCWNWGSGKLQTLAEILAELVRFEASLPEVVDAYAELYHLDQGQGRNTGENDLWIAACRPGVAIDPSDLRSALSLDEPGACSGRARGGDPMSTDTQQVVSKAWNFAHVLRDDGLSYMSYVEQITFLLFLKMADEQTKPPYNRRPIVPAGFDWASLLAKEGDALEAHYRHILETLAAQPGMMGAVFRKAKPEIQNPATLRRLIVDLIEPEKWLSMQADVKGDIYEGLLARSAAESPKGAGQYFTPRELIKAIVDCARPTAADTVSDPACGTGGFLLGAYDYVVRHQGRDLDPDEKKHLKRGFVRGAELVPNTARLCIMNLMLHGIDADPCPIVSGKDSLASPPGDGDRVSLVLTNPPFGKKSTIAIVNEEGDLEKEDESYERPDFWTSTKNKQLNFLQHVKSLLRINGRCAIVVPDNVLFEGGAGETVRRKLLEQCDVHTLLRLPTGIFYAQGVKANVLFFDARPAREKPWTETLWVYDYRTNIHHTLKTRPLKRSDLDEFVACYHPENRHQREATFGESNPEGRWRSFSYDELARRDKLNLDIFWIKDKSLEDAESLPEPDVLALEIAQDLQAALEQFASIAAELKP